VTGFDRRQYFREWDRAIASPVGMLLYAAIEMGGSCLAGGLSAASYRES
jgi:hypothetical protein